MSLNWVITPRVKNIFGTKDEGAVDHSTINRGLKKSFARVVKRSTVRLCQIDLKQWNPVAKLEAIGAIQERNTRRVSGAFRISQSWDVYQLYHLDELIRSCQILIYVTKRFAKLLSHPSVYIYLPTPPLGQDMTQGQFLRSV